MKEKILKLAYNPLISGSIIVTLGSLGANFINFLFNVFLSRNLSIQDYGTVASLLAIITLIGISAGAIIPTIVSFTGESFLKKDYGTIRGIYIKVLRPLLVIASLVLVFFVIFSRQISIFLNIKEGEGLVMITGFIIFLGFISVLNLALFQANLSFKLLSALNILASSMKLMIGLAFLYLGLRSIGVMFAVLLSYVLPYLLGFIYLKFLFKKESKIVKIKFKEIVKFAAPSGMALLALTSLSSADLVLVKHLFNTNDAGIYAGLSLIGRVIFFFTAPIGMVMFPLLTRKKAAKESTSRILPVSLFLVGTSSLMITLFYFLFPAFTINFFLKNKDYLVATSYLGFFGIFMTLYSMCSILMYYFLSVKKTWIYRPIIFAALFQALGIYFFHPTFFIIILISVVVVFSLFLFMLISYFKFNKNQVSD